MLVGTGPSSKQITSKHINDQQIDFIGMNGSIALANVTFKYYVIIDHDFVQQRFDLVQRVLKSNCDFFTTARCLDEILRKTSIEEIYCKINVIEVFSSGKNERFMGKSIKQNINNSEYFFDQNFAFSLNYRDAVFDYYTVAYTALQIAFGLGYKTIYMLGIDLTHLNAPRFYETDDTKQPTLLNHHLDSILTAFNTASLLFRQKEIQVYNLSKSSLIECFPKQVSIQQSCALDHLEIIPVLKV